MSMDEILELEKKREVFPPKKSNVIIEEIEAEYEHENVTTGRLSKKRRTLLSLAWKEPEVPTILDVTQDAPVGGDGDEAIHNSPSMINTINEGTEHTMPENTTLLNVGHQEAAGGHRNETVGDEVAMEFDQADFMNWGYEENENVEPTMQQEDRYDADPTTEMSDEPADRTYNEETSRAKKKHRNGVTEERQQKGKSIDDEEGQKRNPLLDDYYEEGLNSDSGSSDDEGGGSGRYKTFNLECNLDLKVGQRFASKSLFRKILRTYAILNGKDIYISCSDHHE